MKRKPHRRTPSVLPGQLDMFASSPETSPIKPTGPSRTAAAQAKGHAPKTRVAKALTVRKIATAGVVLRVEAAAAHVGLSVSTLNKMRGDGRGPRFIKLTGKVVGYAIEDLDAWLEKRKTVGENR